jgi:serine/threonine protein kinase
MNQFPRCIGKYEIQTELGRGGFALVYKARDPLLDRDVAIKVLHAKWSNSPEIIERFRREAQSVAALRHPHIVTIYDIDELEDGQVYLVMEYLPGLSLAKVLEQEQTLSTDQCLICLGQIADALDCAHERGLIHRDVKPQNIMVERRQEDRLHCVLTDFGLVKALQDSSTLTSAPLGTAAYMAPEQIMHDLKDQVGPATDVYALGIVAYRMLCGRLPFVGDYATVLVAQISEPPPDPSIVCDTVPSEVAAVLLRALDKEPADRYQSVGDMVAALHLAFGAAKLPAMSDTSENVFLIENAVWSPEPLPLPQMLRIPEGHFWMGSGESDSEASENERPRHELYLPGYAIAKYPITNVQYQAFVQATGHPAPLDWLDKQFPPGKGNHPVVNVNYYDACEYCRWLSQVTYQHYRLPMESEWEKAARGRAPETRRYPWGDTWMDRQCNSAEERIGDTTPVDQYEAQNRSLYGIVDMVGNVWEWTDSLYRPYPGSSHYSMAYGRAYVVRGGAWRNNKGDMRISARGRYKPGIQRPYLGFRPVLEVK